MTIVKITTRTSTTATLSDGTEIELPAPAYEWIDPFLSEDGNIFRYAVLDTFCYLEHEWQEGVQFKEFTSEEDRDEWIEARADEGLDVYIVGKHEHGNVTYCVHGEKWFPDMQWDYAPSCAIALPNYTRDPNGFTNTKEAAAAIMDEYTSWCNGDVYGIVEMERDPATGQWSETDATCWGFIGSDNTQQMVKEGY